MINHINCDLWLKKIGFAEKTWSGKNRTVLNILRQIFVFYTVFHTLFEAQVPPLDWAASFKEAVRPPPAELSRTLWDWEQHRTDRRRTLRAGTMKSLLWSLLCCASLLLSDVLATYHLSAGDPQLIAAQSFAQTRNNGRPPIRTLNPASEFDCNLSPKYCYQYNSVHTSVTKYIY